MILTKSHLLIAKIESTVVSEAIPLHEIERVTAVSNSGAHAFEKMMQQDALLTDAEGVTGARRKSYSSMHAFQIFMLENSNVGGRSYSFSAPTKKDCDEWVKFLQQVSAVALRNHLSNDPSGDNILRVRTRGKELYKSQTFQTFISLAIMANYCANLLATEERPEPDSRIERMYEFVEQVAPSACSRTKQLSSRTVLAPECTLTEHTSHFCLCSSYSTLAHDFKKPKCFLAFFLLELAFVVFIWGRDFFQSGRHFLSGFLAPDDTLSSVLS